MAVAELRGRVMASRLHLITVDDAPTRSSQDRLDDAMRRAVVYLEHLERCWSRFIRTSDISRINLLGPAGGTIEVDPSTLTLLRTMIDGYQCTAGRYDPTLLRAVIAEGYHASWITPTSVTAIAAAPERPGSLHDLELNPLSDSVSVPPGLVVDPGGIGKGLAADLTVARLLDEGVDGAMVEIGGDLAMAGVPADPAGWIVGVEHPDPDDGLLCRLAISGGGVATSSVRSRRWKRNGVDRHHQIDPRTATCSATDLTAVSVIAPCGWMAEVHATAALGAGSEHVIGYLDGHGLSGVAVATTPTGERVSTTSDLGSVVFDVGCGVS